MPRDFDVNIKITAENLTRKSTSVLLTSLNAIEGAISRINAASTKLQNVGDNFKSAGKKIIFGTAGAAASLTALGVVGTKFEDRFARVSTLLDTDAQGAIQRYGRQVENLAIAGGKNVNTLTDALFENISALGESKDTVKFLTLANKAAVGGFTDVKTVTDGVTGILNSYNMEVGEGGKIMEQFAIANELGKTTVEELAASVGRGAALAADANVKNTEYIAAITAITKGSLKTSEAVSGLAQMFSNITKPSEQALKVIEAVNKALPKSLKIDFSVAGVKKLGLGPFLERLQIIQKASPEAFARLFESKEARVGISLILKQMKTYNAALGRNEAATSDAVLIQKNYNKAVTAGSAPFMRLLRVLQVLAITIWRSVAPAVLFFVNIFRRIATVVLNFVRNNQTLVRVLFVIAGLFVAVAAVAGVLLFFLGSIIAAFGSFIALFLPGFIALVIIKFFGLFTVLKVLFPIIGLIGKAFGFLKFIVFAIGGAIGFATLKIVAIVAVVAAVLAPIIAFITGFISGLLDGLAPAIEFIKSKIVTNFGIIKKEVMGAASIVRKFWIGVWEDVRDVIVTAIEKIKGFFRFIFAVGRKMGFSIGKGLSDLIGAPAIAVTKTESKAEESGKKIEKINKKTQKSITSNMLAELKRRLNLLKNAGKEAKIEGINIFGAAGPGAFLTERFAGEPVTGFGDRGFAADEIRKAVSGGGSKADNRKTFNIDRLELPNVTNVEDFIVELDKKSISPGFA